MDDNTRQAARLWTLAQPVVSAFVTSVVRVFSARDDVLQEVAVAVIESFDAITSSNSMKPIFVLLTFLLAIVGHIHAAEAAPPTKPNVIFILADDLGVGNVGCYGADNFKTPHIDRLASGGIRYSHAYTVPLCGLTAEPRDWVFIELARQWYVREPQWKLNQAGELFDMSDAPFAEKLVPTSTKDAAALAARQRLQAALDELNPAGGILDQGDGTGRHATRTKKKVSSK
jgi:hypothetical protein